MHGGGSNLINCGLGNSLQLAPYAARLKSTAPYPTTHSCDFWVAAVGSRGGVACVEGNLAASANSAGGQSPIYA